MRAYINTTVFNARIFDLARGDRVSREGLIEAAERLIEQDGVAALTMEGLAAEAGISKGGVQSIFKSKEKLILELVQHWLDRDQIAFRKATEGEHAVSKTEAHINLTKGLDSGSHSKIAALLAVAAHSASHTAMTRAWYSERTNNFTATTAEERRHRLAFLATEGAYFLRFLAGIEFSDDEWADIFADIVATLGETKAAPA